MKIYIDTTFFGHAEINKKHLSLSTSIFTADILNIWKKQDIAKDITLLVNYNHEDFFKENYPEFNIKVLRFFPLTLIWKLTGKVATKYLKKFGIFKHAVNNSKADVLWIPYSVDYTYVKTSVPTVCTVHDIYPVHKKGMKGFEFITDPKVKLTAVSDYTKNDMIKTFNTPKDISVIPNSIVFDVSKRTPVNDLEGKTFILDLNAYIEKKNPMTLLKAYNSIKDKTDAILVFCGGYKDDNLWSQMTEYISSNGLSKKVKMHFRVSDEERNWLLTNARIFVTPSLFEGFGRTPVEAAICNIPVISTKETSLYEATGNLCNYVENPTDEKELADLLLDKLTNPDTKKSLEEISKALAEKYNPELIAKKYIEVFETMSK